MKQSPRRAENEQTVFQAALASAGSLIKTGMRQVSTELKEPLTGGGSILGFIFAPPMPGS